MFGVVEAQAANGADVGLGERAEEEADTGGAVGEDRRGEDVPRYDSGSGSVADVTGLGWEYCVAIVDVPITGEETDQAL